MQKSIRKNYLYNAAYQILLLITPLITAPYLSRVLGADGIGSVSFAESVVSYFTLAATMGISIYGQREISYSQTDAAKRSEVFWNTKMLGFCVSSLVTVVYVVFSLTRNGSAIYLILTLNLFSVFFDITWFFQGMEEFGKTVARNAICKILNVIYIFIFVKNKSDVLTYAFGLGMFTLLGNISLWAYLPRYVVRVPASQLHPFRDWKVVFSLFIPTIAVQIYTVLDKTMIGIITGSPFENGYYEQAVKISRMLMAVVTAMATVVVPRIGYHYGRGEMGEVRRLMYRSYRFAWFLGIPLCFGSIIAADNFVPWFFGAGYEKVIPLLKILSLLIIVIGINNVISVQYLVPTKRQMLLTKTLLAGAATNFVLNSVLIRHFQAIGAAIASVVAETVIAVMQLIILRHELSPVRVLKEGIKYCIAGSVMALVLLPVSRTLSPSILHTAVLVIVGAMVYFLMLFAVRDEFFLSSIEDIYKSFIKRGSSQQQ